MWEKIASSSRKVAKEEFEEFTVQDVTYGNDTYFLQGYLDAMRFILKIAERVGKDIGDRDYRIAVELLNCPRQ